jgi:acyl carrier protein
LDRADAFDLLDLIFVFEETFEMHISEGVAAQILTVKDAVKCIAELSATG